LGAFSGFKKGAEKTMSVKIIEILLIILIVGGSFGVLIKKITKKDIACEGCPHQGECGKKRGCS